MVASSVLPASTQESALFSAGTICPLCACAYASHAVVSYRRLDMQLTRRALSRALPRAGSSRAISTAMMPTTTRSSTSVNAPRALARPTPLQKKGDPRRRRPW